MRPARCAALPAIAALVLVGCGDVKRSSRPASTTTAPPATGEHVQGSGYTLNLAARWHDAKPEGLGADQDLAIADASGDVMTVGRGKVPAAAGKAETVLDNAFRQELESVKPTGVTDPKPIRVDGKPAIVFEFRYTSPDGLVRVREVFAVDKGYFYDFSLITRPELFPAAAKAFAAMLGSVRWT